MSILKKIIIFIILTSFILVYIIYRGTYDMSWLPKDTLLCESTSPNGYYTIKAYVSSGGATTDFAVLGELNYNTIDKSSKNIYWNYHIKTARIKWVDNNTVIINGIKLNVLHDVYDYRRLNHKRKGL